MWRPSRRGTSFTCSKFRALSQTAARRSPPSDNRYRPFGVKARYTTPLPPCAIHSLRATGGFRATSQTMIIKSFLPLAIHRPSRDTARHVTSAWASRSLDPLGTNPLVRSPNRSIRGHPTLTSFGRSLNSDYASLTQCPECSPQSHLPGWCHAFGWTPAWRNNPNP